MIVRFCEDGILNGLTFLIKFDHGQNEKAIQVIIFRMSEPSKHLPRRRFTSNEDQALRTLVCMYGLNRWDTIAAFLPERTSRQCRERYEYYLAPNVYNSPWTHLEDELLETKVAEYGTKWVSLTRFFPGRTGNRLKNRWYKVLSKRIKSTCIVIPSLSHPPLPSQSSEELPNDLWDRDDREDREDG
jgi:hypothetical protein